MVIVVSRGIHSGRTHPGLQCLQVAGSLGGRSRLGGCPRASEYWRAATKRRGRRGSLGGESVLVAHPLVGSEAQFEHPVETHPVGSGSRRRQ